ncbi:MAG: ABC transporter ATP-binding protein [Burkholderiales bacterium]|nr:ABC transporter ATP-binding protein [Burkholderiales bacterium]
MDPRPQPRLELRAIRKAYPAVVANDGIDLDVLPGEIHALLGENGAGKSTLMKIVYGVVQPDSGELLWEGAPVRMASPAHARELGIGMVFQHFSLFETLTVAQNVALALPGKPSLDDVARRIEAIAQRYGMPVDPRAHVHSLSIGERQRVEILRCLLQDLKLLIMDEPTSVLTPQAATALFATLRQLAADGCSILYISHKLDEIKALCHRATVLRAGRVTGACDPRQESTAAMARMMIGRDLPTCQHASSSGEGEPRLEACGLSLARSEPFGTDLRDVSFTLRAGEILGIAGISGNGQQELLAALSGERTLADDAAIRLCGRPCGRAGAAARRRAGLCFVPEERLGRAAIPSMSLADNALLTAHREGMVVNGLLRSQVIDAFTRRCIDAFDVRCGGPAAEAKSLSGGNLQKFIMGREILQRPKVLIAAQPTWGVDVGSSVFIRQALIDLRNAGTAVLVVSEELEELFEICDRLVVIAKGRLSPVRAAAETNVEEIGTWMSGLWPDAADVAEPRDRVAGHAH